MLRERRETLIAMGCLSFLIGVGLATLPGFGLSQNYWLVVALGLLLFCHRKRRFVSILAAVAAGLIFGLLRGGQFEASLAGYHQFVGQKLTLSGTVTEDASYNDRGQRDFKIDSVKIGALELPGQVRVTTYSSDDFRRGSVVEVSGKLMDGFGNYQAALYFAEARVISTSNSPIEWLRHTFAASVLSNIPEPQASLGLGFLLGIKSALPDELNDRLKMVGLTHIVVASGYNLTILIRLARRLLEKRSKYQTAIFSVTMLVGFVTITGFSPSMSRAALVTGLSLAAWYYGRQIHPLVILLLSAAITAGLNPLFLWGDLGWWLSFLSFAGVMLVAPLLQKKIFGERQPKLLGQVVIETVSAQLTTLPLIVATFGTLAVLSLPANVLVVPLVPLAMLLTAVAGLAGWLVPAIAALVAAPASWLLGYMTDVVDLFASPSWASQVVKLDTVGMLICYLVMIVMGLMLWRRTRHNFLSSNLIE